jgi:putative sigma-54 modulation protein
MFYRFGKIDMKWLNFRILLERCFAHTAPKATARGGAKAKQRSSTMQIDIHTSRLTLLPERREQIEHRADQCLGAWASQIGGVSVHLADLNGPTGGVDTRCRVLVMLDNAPDVVVEDVDSDLGDLITACFEQAQRAVAKRLRLATPARRRGQGELTAHAG